MAISTIDSYVASSKQYIPMFKPTRTAVATGWYTLFDLAGNPGAGTLAGTSTSAGVVPDDTVAGFPAINAFGSGATGYLAQVDFGSSVASRLRLFDLVFKAGAYAYTAGTTTLSSQPSYLSRMPGGSYTNTQIWFEVTAAFATGTAWQVQVTYTNQDGVMGRTTPIITALAAAALTLGRMYQLPLQAGDTGVRAIESVIVTNGGTAMTAGNFNVLVMRPLWTGRARTANDGDIHDIVKTSMPVIFADSALYLVVAADSTATGVPELEIVIANG